MTQEKWLYTIATKLIAPNCEVLYFNDDHLEIGDPMRDFQEIPTLPLFVFDRDQARELRSFLNGLDLDSIS